MLLARLRVLANCLFWSLFWSWLLLCFWRPPPHVSLRAPEALLPIYWLRTSYLSACCWLVAPSFESGKAQRRSWDHQKTDSERRCGRGPGALALTPVRREAQAE